MKKLIALTLMVVCLGCFSFGCSKKPVENKTTPTETTTETTDGGTTPAPTDTDTDKPATE